MAPSYTAMVVNSLYGPLMLLSTTHGKLYVDNTRHTHMACQPINLTSTSLCTLTQVATLSVSHTPVTMVAWSLDDTFLAVVSNHVERQPDVQPKVTGSLTLLSFTKVVPDATPPLLFTTRHGPSVGGLTQAMCVSVVHVYRQGVLRPVWRVAGNFTLAYFIGYTG